MGREVSGKHPELPNPRHPLGYSEAEARKILGFRWAEFQGWLRDDLLSFDDRKQPRYWVGNLHSFLHQERLFDK